MTEEISDQRKADANPHDLSSATGILIYLSGRKEVFTDNFEYGPWARRLSRLSVGSTFLVILVGVFFLIFGLRHNAVVRWLIPIMGGVAYVCWVARFVAWILHVCRTQQIWRRPTLVRIVERNEAHALPLTKCNENLLIYVKESLKNHVDKVNGRMNSIVKEKGLFPLLLLVVPVWHQWTAIQAYLTPHFEGGFLSLIREYGYIWVLGIFGWFLLMRFSVWWSMSDFSYQIELVETAIQMKKVVEDQPADFE